MITSLIGRFFCREMSLKRLVRFYKEYQHYQDTLYRSILFDKAFYNEFYNESPSYRISGGLLIATISLYMGAQF